MESLIIEGSKNTPEINFDVKNWQILYHWQFNPRRCAKLLYPNIQVAGRLYFQSLPFD